MWVAAIDSPPLTMSGRMAGFSLVDQILLFMPLSPFRVD